MVSPDRRQLLQSCAALLAMMAPSAALTGAQASQGNPKKGQQAMSSKARIARIWRGRTTPDKADEYERYLRAEGIPPLEKTALGVQLFREDTETESEFVTTSYWADEKSMASFTGGDPTKVHHLPRDKEMLIELPKRVSILHILIDQAPK
jgi:heme-degrading monooxygenase HmoA